MSLKLIILAGLAALVVLILAASWKKLGGFSAGLKKFYREVVIEMKRVAWPSQPEIISATILVSVSTVALVILLGISDKIFGQMVSWLFGVE